MGYLRGQLLACMLLFIGMSGCWNSPSPNPPSPNSNSTNPPVYNLQTTCSGGGGQRTCVSQNLTDDKLGPFDIEIEFLDDRGTTIGRAGYPNEEGIEPRGEWRFTVDVPIRTRSLRFGRITPRNR